MIRPAANLVAPPLDGPPPGAGPVRLGVVMLCHERLDIAGRMARLWVEGGARVAIHVDREAPATAVDGLRAAVGGLDVVFAPRRDCAWGTFSLVAATQDAATTMLDAWPDTTHVLLVSGACLPLRPPGELAAYLERWPGTDFIESVDVRDVGWTVGGLNEERFTLHFPFSFRRQRQLFDAFVNLQRRLGVRRTLPEGIAPRIGSQWWCLTAATLRAILDDPRRAEFDHFFRRVWIPDESYFQTLARRHSRSIESRSLTLAKFDHTGKPYTFYDDHLPLLANSHVFVARKIWPGSKGLYDAFPRPSRPDGTVPEPRPERLEAMLDRAAKRWRLGRPGLYMQSRFPRKDSENGKSARPFAVIYGMGDVVEGLPEWLADVTQCSIQGHLLARNEVEFAGGASVGPGALSSSVGLRDLDPQGFLSSLIRSSLSMPGFLFSPRDLQSLNWFMATDPNAHFTVVTGAWIVPLVGSGMPFDDVRRIAAKLQRVESDFLGVLDSVWVKARVRRWSLAEALAAPDDVLIDLCQSLRPDLGNQLPPLPPLRPIPGLGNLLRDLRNAGLLPRNMGDPHLLRAVEHGPEAASHVGPGAAG